MPMQIVELKYLAKSPIDTMAIASRAEEILHSKIEMPKGKTDSSSILLFHTGRNVQFADGSLPAQTAILETTDESRDYSEEIQQSWGCSNAQELVEACTQGGRFDWLRSSWTPP